MVENCYMVCTSLISHYNLVVHAFIQVPMWDLRWTKGDLRYLCVALNYSECQYLILQTLQRSYDSIKP